MAQTHRLGLLASGSLVGSLVGAVIALFSAVVLTFATSILQRTISVYRYGSQPDEGGLFFGTLLWSMLLGLPAGAAVGAYVGYRLCKRGTSSRNIDKASP